MKCFRCQGLSCERPAGILEFAAKMIYNGVSEVTRGDHAMLRKRSLRGTMRNIFILIIFFLFIYLLLSLRKSKKETGPGKINRCIEILGVNPGAKKEEVDEAYRDLAKVWHPDRFSGNPRLQKKAEEKFKEINAAYEYMKSIYGKI